MKIKDMDHIAYIPNYTIETWIDLAWKATMDAEIDVVATKTSGESSYFTVGIPLLRTEGLGTTLDEAIESLGRDVEFRIRDGAFIPGMSEQQAAVLLRLQAAMAAGVFDGLIHEEIDEVG